MRNALIGAVAALGLAAVWHAIPVAQSQCLHDASEDAGQRSRRMAAIGLVRAINTAEYNEAFRARQQFRPLSDLSVDVGGAPGFEPHFTTDGKTYALMLVDTTDACHFAFSTNQNGVIFQGYPIDYDVQPVRR